MTNHSCLICDRIKQIQEGSNPYIVKELKTGYIVLADFQFIKGYSLFLCKEHVFELHELKKDFKENFLLEMSLVAEAVFKAFKPRKMNYELLGNTHGHMHWHLLPRPHDDINPKGPFWLIDNKIIFSEKARPSNKELQSLKTKLLNELRKIID